MNGSPNNILTHALAYTQQGMKVFPIHACNKRGNTLVCACPKGETCSSPGKHPVASLAPHGCKNATDDPDQIKAWFSKPHNIAIATGAVSGIVALDVDPRHDGERSLGVLEKEYGPLPQTLRFKTGGGGEHIIFKHPGDFLKNSAGSHLGPGIDVRGDGGYIVAPPSRHISGMQCRG